MDNTFLVITSIASSDHPVLRQYASEAIKRKLPFIVIGDTKSPANFDLPGCDFYSVERQQSLGWKLAKELPTRHYSRKNIGYLLAMSKKANIIIETDDDNLPYEDFWKKRTPAVKAHNLQEKGWVNVFKYFSNENIWPRGFPLEEVLCSLPELPEPREISSPIHQGLADDNPDTDAIYRLISASPVKFKKNGNVALGNSSWCPFNSQNTTWFQDAFPLMYLPSCCSFRMTDIWRSFIAARISWTCDWNVVFHNSTVYQERNDHNLINDFKDEIPGYMNNWQICSELDKLNLAAGKENIFKNLLKCYELMLDMKLVDKFELDLVRYWNDAVSAI